MSRCDSVWTVTPCDSTWPRGSKANSGSDPSICSAPRVSRRRWSAAGAARAAAGDLRPGTPRGGEGLAPRRLGGLRAGEDPVDAVVVQPRVGADHRAVEGRLDDLRAL